MAAPYSAPRQVPSRALVTATGALRNSRDVAAMRTALTIFLLSLIVASCGGKRPRPARANSDSAPPAEGEDAVEDPVFADLAERLRGARASIRSTNALLLTPRVALAASSIMAPMVQVHVGTKEPLIGRPAKNARKFIILTDTPPEAKPLYQDTDDAVNASERAKPAALIWETDEHSSNPFTLTPLPLESISENLCEFPSREVHHRKSNTPCLLVVDDEGRLMGYVHRTDWREDDAGEQQTQVYYRRMPFGGKKKQALTKAASVDSGGSGRRRIIHCRLGNHIDSAEKFHDQFSFSRDNGIAYASDQFSLHRIDLESGKIEEALNFVDNMDRAAETPQFPLGVERVQPFEQGFICIGPEAVWQIPGLPKVGVEYKKLFPRTGIERCDRNGRNWVHIDRGSATIHRLGTTGSGLEYPNALWVACDENCELIFPSVDLTGIETEADLARVRQDLVRVMLDGRVSVSSGKFKIPRKVRAVNRSQRVFFAPEGVVPVTGGPPVIDMQGWHTPCQAPAATSYVGVLQTTNAASWRYMTRRH
ncbi:MAG: CBS domain-containing protein [Rhodothermales bacterium]|jgi:CBS domain-containing protein